ncbi:MAG: AAA family ATPase [Candidatus Nanoarchaeia archaeon]|nr:AAA family ATPase [Candidatus Nanoarchaeia archaeon]
MGIFKDILSNSESLFLNEDALDSDYTPPIIKYRENQQAYVANCIKPLLMGRSGKNLFISGSPGIGKTVAVTHILNELKNETEEIETIYINCWKKDTAYKVMLEICNQINYRFTQNRSTDELLQSITKILNKSGVVIVLDEADKLTENSVIYSLLEDLYKKTIILIANDKTWLSDLDERIRSRLMPEILEFNAYNAEETSGILKQRIEFALVPNILENEAFELISKKTYEARDIRSGLFLLKEAANSAESESSKRIRIAHANKAVEKLNEFHIKKSEEFTEEELKILDFIKVNSGKAMGDIHKEYEKQSSMPYRTFFRKIKLLEKARRISLHNEGIGKVTKVIYGSEKKISDF